MATFFATLAPDLSTEMIRMTRFGGVCGLEPLGGEERSSPAAPPTGDFSSSFLATMPPAAPMDAAAVEKIWTKASGAKTLPGNDIPTLAPFLARIALVSLIAVEGSLAQAGITLGFSVEPEAGIW